MEETNKEKIFHAKFNEIFDRFDKVMAPITSESKYIISLVSEGIAKAEIFTTGKDTTSSMIAEEMGLVLFEKFINSVKESSEERGITYLGLYLLINGATRTCDEFEAKVNYLESLLKENNIDVRESKD